MRLSKVAVAMTLVVFTLVADASAQTTQARRFVTGQILVKFRPGASASAKADAHRLAGGALLNEVPRTGVQLVAVPAGSESAAIARYRNNPNVLYSEPNYIRSIPLATTSAVVPHDRYFNEQWALNNTGQQFLCIIPDFCFYVGMPDADIDAPEAWAISTGSPTVTVAVIDTGIDYNHPDLAGKFAGGRDFVNGDLDPMDDHGHGTHVSGTIAAAMSNVTGDPPAEEGVVGVAPNARILAYKVCAADGTCTDAAIQLAIEQAIADRANVINMSFGDTSYSQSLDDAVQDAWNAGLVLVAAAGNGGDTTLVYPAALANVISVGAFDEDDNRASFSTYGSWVDISAPGNVIMSTYPAFQCGGLGTEPGDIGCYNWLSGTSMASPHVAGAAALVWSRSDVTSNQQVVDILLRSADPRGVAAARLDSWTIHGGLNLYNALTYALTNLPPVANAGPDQTVTDSNGDGVELIALDGSGSTDPDGAIASYEWREAGTVIATGATPAVWFAVGAHTLTLGVKDAGGLSSTDTVVITVNALNRPPTSWDVSATTVVGTDVTITLNSVDVETCELAFSIVQGPASGSLGAIQNQTCVAANPNTDTARILYTPGSTAGTYTFTFKTNDGSFDSNIATATITVNAPSAPLAVTGITPGVVSQNVGTRSFVITGTGFATSASVAFENGSGPTPHVVSVTRDSSTQLTAVVDIKSGGPRKNRLWDVRVTNPNGSTAVGASLLTITP